MKRGICAVCDREGWWWWTWPISKKGPRAGSERVSFCCPVLNRADLSLTEKQIASKITVLSVYVNASEAQRAWRGGSPVKFLQFALFC